MKLGFFQIFTGMLCGLLFFQNVVIADTAEETAGTYSYVPIQIRDTDAAQIPSDFAVKRSELEGFVSRFYTEVLDRDPDSSGLSYWVDRMLNGDISSADVARGFVFSNEFINQNTSNDEFLTTLYSAFFDRAPDTIGFNVWKAQLQSGVNRNSVLNGFLEAQEFKNLSDGFDQPVSFQVKESSRKSRIEEFVSGFYQQVLDRQPDSEGLEDWVDALMTQTHTAADVGEGFIFSEEFINQGNNNTEFVKALYRSFLGRSADSTGLANWVDALNAGVVTRRSAMNGFLKSQEFKALVNRYGILLSDHDLWVKLLVKANSDFAFDFYRELTADTDDTNLFISPYSVSSTFAMVWEGAREYTADDIASVLKFSDYLDTNEAVHTAFGELNHRYNQPGKPYELSVSNALWLDPMFPLLDSYLDALSEPYNYALFTADFAENADAERKVINNWLKTQTNHPFPGFTFRGAINSNTWLALNNTTFFQASWAKPFDKELTYEGNFTLTDGSQVGATYMVNHEQSLNFARISGVEVSADLELVEIPYQGNELSMLIILPDYPDELWHVQEQLNSKTLNNWLSQMRKQKIDLTLPRFSLKTQHFIDSSLQSLGMASAFHKTADFTGMNDVPDNVRLYIGDAYHQAEVQIDEAQTVTTAIQEIGQEVEVVDPEASGGSSAAFVIDSGWFTPLGIQADRPFLFLIRDNQTGSILFLGRVKDPSL